MIINNDGEGTFYLIEPTPAGFKMLSKAKLVDSKEAWAPLALSDGKLVIRDQKQMKCVQVK
jgi:outer membrane protein assembly factor BamB